MRMASGLTCQFAEWCLFRAYTPPCPSPQAPSRRGGWVWNSYRVGAQKYLPPLPHMTAWARNGRGGCSSCPGLQWSLSPIHHYKYAVQMGGVLPCQAKPLKLKLLWVATWLLMDTLPCNQSWILVFGFCAGFFCVDFFGPFSLEKQARRNPPPTKKYTEKSTIFKGAFWPKSTQGKLRLDWYMSMKNSIFLGKASKKKSTKKDTEKSTILKGAFWPKSTQGKLRLDWYMSMK